MSSSQRQPEDEVDGNQVVLELQERIIRAESEKEEQRSNLAKINVKLRQTFEELEKVKLENFSLKEKQNSLEQSQSMKEYLNDERKGLLERSNKLSDENLKLIAKLNQVTLQPELEREV